MEIIKRKILFTELEDNLYLKIPLYQNIDNMGLRTDMPFPSGSFISEPISNYFKQGGLIISASDSKLSQLKSYDEDEQYKIDFNIKRENYVTYQGGDPITGVDRVTNIDGEIVENIDGETVTYVFDAVRDSFIGTTGQTTGILYQDNPVDGVSIPEELDGEVTSTRVQYMSEGWNETNVLLEAQIQEEYLLGIISEPEVESDVFIDRSTFSVLDKHLRLSEVESLDHLTRYGNGFYNINRD